MGKPRKIYDREKAREMRNADVSYRVIAAKFGVGIGNLHKAWDDWHQNLYRVGEHENPVPQSQLSRVCILGWLRHQHGNYETGNCRWATASQQATGMHPRPTRCPACGDMCSSGMRAIDHCVARKEVVRQEIGPVCPDCNRPFPQT